MRRMHVYTRLFNDNDPWLRWFGRVLQLIETYDIDMWSYINCQWDSQPMWHKVGFGDTRLSTNDYVMEQWQKYVIESEGSQTFLMGNSLKCDMSRERSATQEKSVLRYSIHESFTLVASIQFALTVACIYVVIFSLRGMIRLFRKDERLQSEMKYYGATDESQPILL